MTDMANCATDGDNAPRVASTAILQPGIPPRVASRKATPEQQTALF